MLCTKFNRIVLHSYKIQTEVYCIVLGISGCVCCKLNLVFLFVVETYETAL